MARASERQLKKFSSRMQARLLLVFCVIILLLVGLMGRLIFIVHVDGDRFTKRVLARQSYVTQDIPYRRGAIMDRNGTVLAKSELQYKLVLDPKLLLLYEDCIEPTLTALTSNFALEAQALQSILDDDPNSQYKILLKHLNYQQVQDFKKVMSEDDEIMGVWFEEEYVRTYPYDTLACDVLGFTSSDNRGYFGIEESYNEELNGTNGREYGYFDSTLNIERILKKPVNGDSIISTIDMNAQRIIQKHIKTFNQDFGSENIGVLVMNPNNGEILAMASNQEYNLNQPRELEGLYTKQEISSMTEEEKITALNELWKNDALGLLYEPGSTFKPFTIASALEENVITVNDTYQCDGGQQIGPDYIQCSNRNGHGLVTLQEAIMKSCNDALMQIADKEGRHVFADYVDRFGFGHKTGIDLPGEEAGIVKKEDKIHAVDLATNSFGQNINVSMVQMAAAFSSLVNGGSYYEPHIVKQIINDSGATVKQFDKVLARQTVSEKTSKFLQESLYKTVEEGTAGGAKVTGYAIGGKTGTAQKYPRGGGTYLVSFLGQVPAIHPEIVIYVIVDEPQNVVRQDDSSIATKLASRIMTELLPAVSIYPDGEIDYLLSPENLNQTQNGNGGSQGNNQEANQNNNVENNNNTENNNTENNGTGQENNPGGSEGSEHEERSGNPDGNSQNNEEDEFNGAAIE